MKWKHIKRFFIKLSLWFFGLSLALVLLFRFVPVPYTPLMAIRSISYPEESLQHKWVPMEEISKQMQLAVICSEDQRFLEHWGFDLKAINKAIEESKKGKRLRGGSTISQQTAKNVFLWPGRSWLRKGFESYFTLLIEVLWPKERILEVYLNSVEMGPGVYGVEAAAKHWFGKSATDLTRSEAASIAAILPNPRAYRPIKRTEYIENRRRWIVKQMGYFGPLDFDKSTDEP